MKTQAQVLARLEAQTRKAGRALEDRHAAAIQDLWRRTTDHLEGTVLREYRHDFGRKTWDAIGARRLGTLQRIAFYSQHALATFTGDAHGLIARALADVYRNEAARQLWMLDQVTPPSVRPRWPSGIRRPREAGRAGPGPRDYKADWATTLSTWTSAYLDALNANLKIASLHEGDLHDAADTVAETKISGGDPAAKLSGLLAVAALTTQANAGGDVAAENATLVEEEVWQTLQDARVCPECDGYEGKTIEEVGFYPPAHLGPCRCFPRVVPKAWAELLRSGDPDEKEAALRAEELGLVPTSMALRGPHGGVTASVVVTFADWVEGAGKSIVGEFSMSR